MTDGEQLNLRAFQLARLQQDAVAESLRQRQIAQAQRDALALAVLAWRSRAGRAAPMHQPVALDRRPNAQDPEPGFSGSPPGDTGAAPPD